VEQPRRGDECDGDDRGRGGGRLAQSCDPSRDDDEPELHRESDGDLAR
jgi:hypothetical protein